MNRLAVALAADSAATVTAVQGNKIHNSADKLFMLSKKQPVGIMIYGSASLLGVPWETIVKMFRRKLGPREYPKLEDYGAKLLAYLNDNDKLFPQEVQDEHFLLMLRTVLGKLARFIREKLWEDLFADGIKCSEEQTREFATQRIIEWRDRWKQLDDATCFHKNEPRTVLDRHSGKVNNELAALFGDMSLGPEGMGALYELAYMLMTKNDYPPECSSGVVIAGFGEDQHFPVMQAFTLGGIYEGKLKYKLADERRVTSSDPSHVVPFAHTDMVETFLHGISPNYKKKLWTNVLSLIQGLPKLIIDEFSTLGTEDKEALIERLKPITLKSAQHVAQQMKKYSDEQHLAPIRQAITHSPKDQIAHIAASLVNLNSLQKRMSLKPETVGGPVDVAVISKGDGFIWIDRKHYFKPELNPQFFRNYDIPEPRSSQLNDPTDDETGPGDGASGPAG